MSRRAGPVTEHDLEELRRFGEWMRLESARRSGSDPRTLQVAETALYPEGIGREVRGGENDAGARVIQIRRW